MICWEDFRRDVIKSCMRSLKNDHLRWKRVMTPAIESDKEIDSTRRNVSTDGWSTASISNMEDIEAVIWTSPTVNQKRVVLELIPVAWECRRITRRGSGETAVTRERIGETTSGNDCGARKGERRLMRVAVEKDNQW